MLPVKDCLIDGHTHVGVDLLFYLRGYYPYAQDWPSLVAKGQTSGIARFVVFPMVSHLGLNVADLREGRISGSGGLEGVPYAYENRRLMVELTRRFPEHAEAALPLWMIDPSRSQAAQVEALRKLHEEFPCSGLKIQATVIQSFIADLLGTGACLLDLAEEKNWPVLIHTSVHPEDPWSRVEDILAVAKARPRLRFNLAHSCRFDLAALEEVASLPNTWSDCSAHRIHCHTAVRNAPNIAPPERRFPTDYRDPVQVLGDLAAKYPSKVIWGSDAPFDCYVDDEFDLRSTYQEEADVLHQLGEETKRRIGMKNTLDFLGISQ